MRLKSLALLFILVFISGCAALKPQAAPEGLNPPTAIRAEAVVELKKTITLAGRAVILAKSPDLFRIEVFGPFGQVMALLVSDGSSLYIYSGGEEKEFLWNDPLLPYSFKANEVVSFLLGNSVPIQARAGKNFQLSMDENGRLEKAVKFKKGSPSLVVRLSDYRPVEGAILPFNISIEDGKEKFRIKYSSVDIKPRFDADSFSIDPSGEDKKD